MSEVKTNNAERIPRASWIILAAVAILTTLSGLFVAITPAGSQTDLNGRTWDEFASGDPEVAALFSMQLALVGISFAAFSIFGAITAVVPYRNGKRWAWFLLWLLPLVYGVVSVKMLTGGYQVGYYYLGLFVTSLIALLIPVRRIL
jgi:hypothetical protein